LKDLGVQVAIDDFGTGYSNLSYLRQFPINVLKVDQAFVHEISADPAGTSIVCAVISMGKSLGHRVIAEGVETGEQLAFLQAQRCGEGQGYFFSRPLAADEFVKLLDTRSGETCPPVIGDTGRAADALNVMTDDHGVPAISGRGLGLRRDQERRRGERRAATRGTRDRRKRARRRVNFRSLLFTAMLLSVPHQLRHSPLTFSHALRAPELPVAPSIDTAIATPLSQAYDGLIHEAAVVYGVSPTLIRSVMQAESAFDPAAISRAGAMGLMQLMPEVARAFGIADPFDPRENMPVRLVQSAPSFHPDRRRARLSSLGSPSRSEPMLAVPLCTSLVSRARQEPCPERDGMGETYLAGQVGNSRGSLLGAVVAMHSRTISGRAGSRLYRCEHRRP